MVAWTLEACRNSLLLDRVVVSTDDGAVAAVATAMGFQTLPRPEALAGPDASVIDAIGHALAEIGETWDYVALLQPTSPLRRGGDIDAAVRRCEETGAPAVIGVSPMPKPKNFYGRLDAEGRFRANDVDPDEAVIINGAIYVGRPDTLLRDRTFQSPGALGYLMPPERGWDVDTLFDFVACEALWPHVRGQTPTVLGGVRR